jgi:hypothetical protein
MPCDLESLVFFGYKRNKLFRYFPVLPIIKTQFFPGNCCENNFTQVRNINIANSQKTLSQKNGSLAFETASEVVYFSFAERIKQYKGDYKTFLDETCDHLFHEISRQSRILEKKETEPVQSSSQISEVVDYFILESNQFYKDVVAFHRFFKEIEKPQFFTFGRS